MINYIFGLAIFIIAISTIVYFTVWYMPNFRTYLRELLNKIDKQQFSEALTADPVKFSAELYGSAIASVYDDIYGELQAESSEIMTLKNIALKIGEPKNIVELGVGTGRVLAPLAEALSEYSDFSFIGVDGSTDMLSLAKTKYPNLSWKLANADISNTKILKNIITPGSASLILCVCGTFSMLPDRETQKNALQNIAKMLSPSGVAIIETHAPEFVLANIGIESTSRYIPYPKKETGLLYFSSIENEVWRMRQFWVNEETVTEITELSLLTQLEEITEMAGAVGLEVEEVTASFSGGEYLPQTSPLYSVKLRHTKHRKEEL